MAGRTGLMRSSPLPSWRWGGFGYVWVILLFSQLPVPVIQGSGIRLNVPRVRLPYFDTFSVNFTLHVDTPGCYKWTSSRSDIIKLTTTDGKDFDSEGTECSDRVVISTSQRPSITLPASATVFAEEVNTKENVRCDVIVDKIEAIKIVTTNSYVHLEEAPTKFHVRGYGSHDNEFSTMDGIPMKWWLEAPPPTTGRVRDPHSTMRFLQFSESLYEAKPAIAALEAKRLQGSEVLVEGLKTGSVVVNARIQPAIYKHVPKTEVTIVALANLLLEPSDVYIVPDTTVPLKLIQLKRGRLFEIRLPSDAYVFEVENTTVATYDTLTSTVTGLVYGETKITVRDKNNLDNQLTDPLTAYIYVREPKFLAFTVKPYQNWALMMGQPYTITVDIFDADSQKIYVGNNIFIKTTFETSLFKPEISSSNGTYHVGKGIRTGSAKVTAELDYIVRTDGSRIVPSSNLKVHADMEIFQRIAINPKLTVLPWDPFTSPKHEIIFKASGGNGNFFWNSTNSTVVTVTQGGHSRTEFYGMANITAAMTINSHINGAARVYVLLPTSMKIVDHIVEAEIGAPILIPLAFYTTLPDDTTETLVPFSTCRNLNFKVQIEDPSFVYESQTYYPHAKPACAYLPIVGSQLGSTVVTVSYSVGGKLFTDSVTVSTFKPLKVVEPVSSTTVLAVGSSRQLVFEGGPRPLVERMADFSKQMLVANKTVAKVSDVKFGHLKEDLYIYEVVCQEVGQTLVTLEIGNSRESNDRIPVRRTADVQVICGDPAKIYFKIETVLKQDDLHSKCPQDLSTAQVVRIPVPNYENILVSVTVKDGKGNKFDNISSLNINWRTSLDIVTFQHQKYIPTEILSVNEYTVPGKSYQTILPIGTSGHIEVTAEIVGYRPEVLNLYNIRSNMRLTKIDPAEEYLFQRSLSMDLQLVSDVTLEPQSTTLFNHPSSKTVVKVVEGSGYFEVSSFPASVVETKYFENNKTIQIKPIREGEAKVVVRDLCLPGRPTAETIIQVNGVGTIVLRVADKIQVSNSTILTVLLYDKNGNALTPKDLSLITLKPISLTSDLIEIHPVDSLTAIEYKITGKNVGDATIGFVAEGPSRSSRSEVKRILVFSPLSIQPKELTLLVGSVYQVLAQGGPQPDSLTNFTSEAKAKVAVHANGIIQGRSLGSSKVTAKSIDQTSGVIYSEDSMEVNVVNLIGIRIHTALTKVHVNETIPVWAIGLTQNGQELDPVILFGGKSPLMTFEWNIGNSGNAEIEYPFQEFGLIPKNDQPYFRFRAKIPGQVKIILRANMTTKEFIAETVVEIFEELRILNVPISYTPILLSPNAEISLKTNKESTGHVTYSLFPLKGLDEISWNEEATVVSVDSLGTLRSKDKIGDAVVRVTFVDNNSGITESVGFIISVRLVAYHMLTPSLSVKFHPKRRNVDTIPRGIPFRLTVSYHDGFGRRFHATNISPKIRPNRFDIIQFTVGIQNDTFNAQTTSEGRVGILAIDSQKPGSKDFLFASVTEAIEPRFPLDVLNVGDVTCFSCGVKSMENGGGVWSASPTDLLQLDSQSGRAWAVSPGIVKVQYSIPGAGKITSVDLTIRNIHRISFFGKGVAAKTVIATGSDEDTFDVNVKLGDSFESLRGPCDLTTFPIKSVVPSPFDCSLAFENEELIAAEKLFSVSGVFLPEKGHYACRIKPIDQPHLQFRASAIKSKLILTATMKSFEKDYKIRDSSSQSNVVATQPLSLPFQPRLYLHTSQIKVTNKDPEGVIYVTGNIELLKQIKFVPSDPSFLEIDKHGVTKEDLHTNGFLDARGQLYVDEKLPQGIETRGYRVKVLQPYWFSADFSKVLGVTLNSQNSKQSLNIPILVTLTSPFASSETVGGGLLGGFILWMVGISYYWLIVPLTTLVTLGIVHLLWKHQDSRSKDGASDFVFVSRTSPRSSTPVDTQRHFRLGSFMGDGSPSTARRLYSTDSPFNPQRYSTGSSPSSGSFTQ